MKTNRQKQREKEIDIWINNHDVNRLLAKNTKILPEYQTHNIKKELVSQLYMNPIDDDWNVVLIKKERIKKIINIDWDGVSDYCFGYGVYVQQVEDGSWNTDNKMFDVRYDRKEVYIYL